METLECGMTTLWIGMFAVAVAVSFSVRPQQTARDVLTAALDRLGGREAVAAIPSWFVAGSGEENLTGELQGLSPADETLREHAEWIGVDAANGGAAWERRTPRNDSSLRWRRFIYRHDSSGVIVWTDSIGYMNSGAAPLSRRRALMRRIPHLLLLDAATRADSATLGDVRMVLGKPHRAVHVSVEQGERLTLWISTDSSLLHRVEYQTLLPGRGDVTVTWEWADWRPASEVRFAPSGHRVLIGGRMFQRVRYSRFAVRSPAADSMLMVAPALRARRSSMAMSASPEAALPANGQVSPGVHVESVAGFNILVVEFRDFVVVAEAPAFAPGFEAIPATRNDARIGDELVSRVRAIAGAKPVRYAVLGHHHSDHVGGVRALASLGATIIVPADSKSLVEAALAAPHTQARDANASAPRVRVVEAVSTTRSITDGSRRLELYNVGMNPHTTQNVFVWLPAERIAFQGDLFYYQHGGRYPPSGREAMNAFFVRWLAERDLRPRAIYGVHNDGAAPASLLR
jgi:glyoxylase-like metal-dependent hydrolase (beta-lactamase superfamily II)